ncbi:MAG: peptide chain release factor N(5)-glutamine methyltransferase [Chloroflexi bacterium]|nr:peptide chain release factor N(5)-glutamine methyltransferase [Chloroflexota bacterium]
MNGAVTVTSTLEQGRQRLAQHSETAALDAQVLLAHIFGKNKAWILAHPEKSLDATRQMRWEDDLTRLEGGEPLPYVIGEWEFYGLKLKVTPAVLIPRPETELLVESGLDWLAAHPSRRQVLDVGTGSGCIPVALSVNAPDLRVTATDISPEALEVARTNVERYQLSSRIQLVETNLIGNIEGSFDLICANLPYIPDGRLPLLAVSKWEPHTALGGGADGLRFIEPFLEQAAAKLPPHGLILAEIDASLETAVKELAKAQFPEAHIEVRKDLAGLPRLLVVDTK